MSFWSWLGDFFMGGAEFGNELDPGPESDIREIAIAAPAPAPEPDVKPVIKKVFDRRLFLKIKLQNLRSEVDLIRSHERRLKAHLDLRREETALHHIDLISQMVQHRRTDIREETRATHLAYGYIRGLTYEEIEHNARHESYIVINRRVERIAKMVNKYSVPSGLRYTPDQMQEHIRNWLGVDKYGRRFKDLQKANA